MVSNYDVMKNAIFPLLAIIISTTLSCQKHLDVEFPPHRPEFVLNASLEPGKPIHVFVTDSRDVLDARAVSPVRDAMVEIIEEGQKAIPLTFKSLSREDNSINGYTTEEQEIRSGGTYELIVSGRLETAKSKVSIPEPVAIKAVEITQAEGEEADFTVTFDDPEGRNYYEFVVYFRGINVRNLAEGRSDTTFYEGNPWLAPLHPAYQREFSTGRNLLIDDLLFEGREVKVGFSAQMMRGIELEVTVFLKNITEYHYNYHTALGLQRNTRDDPFAQPVHVPSNVENGLGVVKASAASSFTTTVLLR